MTKLMLVINFVILKILAESWSINLIGASASFKIGGFTVIFVVE